MHELRIIRKKSEKKYSEKKLIKEGFSKRDLTYFEPENYFCRLKENINFPDTSVLNFLYHEGNLVTACDDKTIKIWDIENKKVLNVLQSHQSAIYSLCINEDILISSSSDRTLKFWEVDSWNLLGTILGHSSHVYSVITFDNIFISASIDKTIKIWDFNTKKLLKVINTGENSALSIARCQNKLFAGLSDGTIQVWDINTGGFLLSVKEHTESVNAVFSDGNIVISGSKDKSIKIWDSELNLINTLKGHNSGIWTLFIDKNKLISGGDDKTVRIWDIDSARLLSTMDGHKDWVSCVTSERGLLFSSDASGMIKIWIKMPSYNLDNIEIFNPKIEKSPFETDSEFYKKQETQKKDYLKKLISYDYIGVGKLEILVNDYDFENDCLPVSCKLSSEKLISFTPELSRYFKSKIKISVKEAEIIYKKSTMHDFYIRFYFENEILKYEMALAYENIKYNIDLNIENIQINNLNKSLTNIKTARLNIKSVLFSSPSEECDIKPIHNCNSIDTTDTFKSPFESLEKFEQRVKEKFLEYGDINIGNIELSSEQYSIDKMIFPLKVNISCDKILNIAELKKEFNSSIIIERYKAKNLFEKSKKHYLYIKFFETEKGLFFRLSIIFEGVRYFLTQV